MAELKRQNFRGAFFVEYEYYWTSSSPEIAQCGNFGMKLVPNSPQSQLSKGSVVVNDFGLPFF